MRKLWVVPVFAIIAGAAYLYWNRVQREVPPRNVLLITIDTLRADHLGCYGYGGAQTPNIDRWAEKGAVFFNATAVTPLTLPSHSSIMTGMYPFAHGVRDNGGFYLEESRQTVAESLHAAGVSTGGFVSAFVLDRRWGIAQGFDEYFDHFELSKYKMISLDSVQRKGEETLEQALAWIDQKKDSRFFAWIHLYDPHTPYDPPEPFYTEFKKRGAYGLYDGEVAYTDNLIGRINDYLEKNRLLSTTLVVLTSDHGESLGDHQESGHGFFIYDSTTHVPLIVLLPGEEPQRINDQVRSIDLYPTICDAVGVTVSSSMHGTSLLPLVRGKSLRSRLAAYSESYYPRFHYGWSELKALRTTEYKYIDAPEHEFYRLSSGAREIENLYRAEADKASAFEKELAQLAQQSSAEARLPQAMDNDSLEKLQALGYIGSYTAPLQKPEAGPLPDPKGKIKLYNLLKLAQWNSAEGKTGDAFKQIRSVIEEDPKILEAHLVLGNLYMKEKNYPDARGSFQRALSVNPEFSSAVFGLAKAYEEEKQWDAAKAGFERLAEIDPRDTKVYFHLGEIAVAQQNLDEALRHFQKLVTMDPQQALSRLRLGACYLDMKLPDKAMTEFRKALELNPRLPNAHFNTALIYEERGELEPAITEYLKELSLYPDAYTAHFNLSRIYRIQKRLPDERKELEACIRQMPDFGVAYLYLGKNLMDSGADLLKAKAVTEEGMGKTLEEKHLPFGHYLLADICNRLGQQQQAMAHVRKARQLER